MKEEDKQLIESLLHESSDYNLTRLKDIMMIYGGPTNTGCFCKSGVREQYLNQIKEWYNSQINND